VLSADTGSGERFKLQPHSFPNAKTSWWLTWRNLAFPLLNPSFGWVLGALYLVVGWPIAHRIGLAGGTHPVDSIANLLRAAIEQLTPGQILILQALYVGGVLFTDTHSRFYRVAGGAVHTTAHIATAFLLAAVAALWIAPSVDSRLLSLLASGTFVGVAGAVAGSFIWGLYLLTSLNVFGRHANEAFSSLRIADYKNFLRMRISPNGELSIYPIGIERVPRWRRWWARARKGSAPRLIEGPVKVKTAASLEI
jgi:hypothetical protein